MFLILYFDKQLLVNLGFAYCHNQDQQDSRNLHAKLNDPKSALFCQQLISHKVDHQLLAIGLFQVANHQERRPHLFLVNLCQQRHQGPYVQLLPFPNRNAHLLLFVPKLSSDDGHLYPHKQNQSPHRQLYVHLLFYLNVINLLLFEENRNVHFLPQ